MLRRLFFLSAILILTFTATAFGQSNKRTLSKPKNVKQAKKGVAEWTDILARKTNKRKPKPYTGSPTDGNGIRKAPTGKTKANQRKGGITHTDSWDRKSKRKVKPRSNSVILFDQDGETEVARKKRKRNK